VTVAPEGRRFGAGSSWLPELRALVSARDCGPRQGAKA